MGGYVGRGITAKARAQHLRTELSAIHVAKRTRGADLAQTCGSPPAAHGGVTPGGPATEITMSRTEPTAKKPLFIVRHLARRPCCVCALSAGLGILLSGIFGVGFIVGFVPLGIDLSADGMAVRGDAVAVLASARGEFA